MLSVAGLNCLLRHTKLRERLSSLLTTLLRSNNLLTQRRERNTQLRGFDTTRLRDRNKLAGILHRQLRNTLQLQRALSKLLRRINRALTLRIRGIQNRCATRGLQCRLAKLVKPNTRVCLLNRTTKPVSFLNTLVDSTNVVIKVSKNLDRDASIGRHAAPFQPASNRLRSPQAHST